MSNKNKYIFITLGVIVLGIIIWVIYSKTHKQSTPPPSQSNQTANSTTTPPPTPTSTPPSNKKLTYGAAIKAYPYRFQFSLCHATPGSISVRKGDVVMLDNRDNKAHTIKTDGQSFRIAGYDYALLYTGVISSSNVTCDGGGAGTLNVEK